MSTRCDRLEHWRVLKKAGFENTEPAFNDDRIIVEEVHLGLIAEISDAVRVGRRGAAARGTTA